MSGPESKTETVAQVEPQPDQQAGQKTENQPQSQPQPQVNDAASTSTPPQSESKPEASDPVAELTAKLAAAEAKVKENYDSFLRAKADMENMRRRAQEDVAKAHKFGIENFAENLLPVFDSLYAALADQTGDTAKLREGVELTLRQLKSAFEKGKLIEIDPAGQKFDPHRHQAISMQASDSVAPNHVITVLQKGWMISDRILRPALVVVAQGA